MDEITLQAQRQKAQHMATEMMSLLKATFPDKRREAGRVYPHTRYEDSGVFQAEAMSMLESALRRVLSDEFVTGYPSPLPRNQGNN